MPESRPLRVFLCHSSNDKAPVRELYQQLRAELWIQPWLDEEELYPGQDWNLEIEKAVEAADAILVCLSKGSITKEGYVQRELQVALDFADYKPEGTLYIIPVRLEECDPPRRLRTWQYADYFAGSRERSFQRLLVSLKRRAESLRLISKSLSPEIKDRSADATGSADLAYKPVEPKSVTDTIGSGSDANIKLPLEVSAPPIENTLTLSNGMEFMRVPAGKFLMGSKPNNKRASSYEKPQYMIDIPYDYWMARFPVTNEIYNAYIGEHGLKHPVDRWNWKPDHPVVRVKWVDAMAYCRWLNGLLKVELPSGLVLRLPTEAEWEKAARGTDGREFPWGSTFDKNNCNTSEGGKGGTSPVRSYSPQGDSPYGCADMSGNVSEWMHSLKDVYPYSSADGREDASARGRRVIRGGSYGYNEGFARCAYRNFGDFDYCNYGIGFRVAAAPSLADH